MSEIELRPATVDDTQAVTDCIAAAYATALRDFPDLPDVTDGVAEDIANQTAWVAVQGGDIMGFIVFGQVDVAVMIYNLAVSPSAQGKGLATRLLGVAETSARVSGLKKLRLRTHRLMKQTVSLYLHMGWVQQKVSGNSVLMEKTLLE